MGLISRLFGFAGTSKKEELRRIIDSTFAAIENDRPGNFTPEGIMNSFGERLLASTELKQLGTKQDILKALAELERENQSPLFGPVAHIIRIVVD